MWQLINRTATARAACLGVACLALAACEKKPEEPLSTPTAATAKPTASAATPGTGDESPELGIERSKAKRGSVLAAEPAGKLVSLKVGDTLPDLVGTTQDGSKVELAKLRGKPVVVYFYPKDDTPGCTIEAKEFRDETPELKKRDAVVLGVSTDGEDSHKAFADKYKLTFKLVADPDKTWANAFKVPVARGYASRMTFVLDKEGKVAKVFEHVNPNGHAADVLRAIDGLS